jgi:hypothetical protein
MRPGVTSAVLRWRVGAWLVGAGLVLLVADIVFLHKGFGFWCLCLFLMMIGALVANPLRVMGRLRAGGHADPVVRLKPLGVVGFIVMMVLFLVPFAIGEWLLNMVGEMFERRSGSEIEDEDPVALAADEETLSGHPPSPWPGAEGFEDIFYDEQDPNRKRVRRLNARRRLTRR